MATAHKIRDLIAQTTTGTARHHVPREVRDEVCRYARRRRSEGAAWAVIARETGLGVPKGSNDGTHEPGPLLRSRCCARWKWCRSLSRRKLWL